MSLVNEEPWEEGSIDGAVGNAYTFNCLGFPLSGLGMDVPVF